MKIGIIGGGAIGSVYAGLLATNPSLDVWLLTRRRQQIDVIERDGLRIDIAATASNDGKASTVVSRPRVIDPDPSSRLADLDAVLISAKAYEMGYAGELAARVLCRDGVAVPLSNGVGHYETLSALIGPDRVAAGATYVPASYIGPGHARRDGRADALTLFGAESSSAHASERLCDALNNVGLKSQVIDDIERVIWMKLAVAMCGPVAAVVRAPVGVLAACPPLRELIFQASDEAVAVAMALGIVLDGGEVRRTLEGVIRDAAETAPSMLQDVLNDRPTEIDARSGAIAALGRKLGVPTPVNDCLHSLVKGVELTSRLSCRRPPIK